MSIPGTIEMIKVGRSVPAMLIGSAVAVIISLASVRLSADQFVLATFGFQSILFCIFENWVGVTRGPFGISGIPHPRIIGFSGRFTVADADLGVGFGVALLCGGCTACQESVRKSPPGNSR